MTNSKRVKWPANGAPAPPPLPYTEVTLSPVGGGGASPRPLRGIYLREPHQAVRPSSFSVTVYPKLHEVCVACSSAPVEEAWLASLGGMGHWA